MKSSNINSWHFIGVQHTFFIEFESLENYELISRHIVFDPYAVKIWLPWISSLNVQYWFWYFLRSRNAFILAKSSNWIRQFMPYLWDKTFTLEVNEVTFKNKPLKLAYQFSSVHWSIEKAKHYFLLKVPSCYLVQMWNKM